MLSKRYQLINNICGWSVFVIALLTYWLTLEPTASYWDCGEFIIQADKLEVGHPPGNPIFMLTARFFANFAPSTQYVSLMVNAMSGLLSALTILLLFWTITHLVRRLIVADNKLSDIALRQYIVIMGAGVAGALAYCWSDTFWFSAVEGEVYAFSSFCTALVFWLILKWEYRADLPHSDRYLILIAYIIGISVAVHLLNLLCIPAIVLVFVYRKYKNMDVLKSLLALAVSFVIIFFVLYGLVPGFIRVAQQFELVCVNSLGMSFNSGALIYWIVMAVVLLWSLYALYVQKNSTDIKISFMAVAFFSGIFYINGSWWIAALLLAALALWLWWPNRPEIPVRVLNVIAWSIATIFIGYSSYALILIRSTADTPMNQNSPDNVFALASYLNREQYGQNPLIYGETMNSGTMKEVVNVQVDTLGTNEQGYAVTLATPSYNPIIDQGKPTYVKGVKNATPQNANNFLTDDDRADNFTLSQKNRDYYVKSDYSAEPKLNPELNMLFPRLYSNMHRNAYAQWVNMDTVPGQMVTLSAIDPVSGNKVPEYDTYQQPAINETTGTVAYPVKTAYKPTYAQNLSYFLNYQLNHMYLRYFMWNFAGRQNDIMNQEGELDAGNWISGFSFIDNPRLGDQSLLPDELGKDNAGHNVYFMFPLILGLIGLIWQSFAGKRGIEQFWVVFFLFFMTGIAIVIYLNQTPGQPRERDYAFAGSFYAFAIWIGMGVPGLWRLILKLANPAKKQQSAENKEFPSERNDNIPEQAPNIVDEPQKMRKTSLYCAAVATVIGLAVPAQMVSQTWDDHDRSGRYAARDFAANYLESLEPNAIVFCNGDNDTFPLWYAQEVEGIRPDVKIINLSYLASDWYANQQRLPSYDAAPVDFTATPADYAYENLQVTLPGQDRAPTDLLSSLKILYQQKGNNQYGYPMLPSAVVTIPVDKDAVIKRGLVAPKDSSRIENEIVIDLAAAPAMRQKGYLSLSEILMLDIIATNAAKGWPRPIYWAMTVGEEYHLGLTPYLRSTGMTHQIVPTIQESPLAPRTDRAFDVITRKYLWGGADITLDKHIPYFDETARRMVSSTRMSMVELATELIYEGDLMKDENHAGATKKWKEALAVLNLLEAKLPSIVVPYSLSIGCSIGELYCELGSTQRLNETKVKKRGLDTMLNLLKRYAQNLRYRSAVDARFGANMPFTVETRLVPYQYYRIVEIYLQNGGNRNTVEKILKPTGFSLDKLKENFDMLQNGGSPSGQFSQADDATLKQYAQELSSYAEIANRLEKMSPSEYAAQKDDERVIDSTLWFIIDLFKSQGGTEEMLAKDPNFQKLNKQRSEQLFKEYVASHPELQ